MNKPFARLGFVHMIDEDTVAWVGGKPLLRAAQLTQRCACNSHARSVRLHSFVPTDELAWHLTFHGGVDGARGTRLHHTCRPDLTPFNTPHARL
jgi:hypothetical protein